MLGIGDIDWSPNAIDDIFEYSSGVGVQEEFDDRELHRWSWGAATCEHPIV